MKKTGKVLIGSVMAAMIVMTGLVVTTEEGTSVKNKIVIATSSLSTDFEFVKETEYPVAIGHGSFESYGNLEDMFAHSVLVAEVKIKDSKTVYLQENPPLVETWLEAEIKQTFKGDSSMKSVTIAEFGGVMDMSKSKDNEMRSSGGPIKEEPFIEDAPEGAPVMKKGNTYMVFLSKGASKDVYVITGSVQGKVRISDTSNKGVVTIDPDHFAEHMQMFWLQRKFAGKDKVEISEVLKNVKAQ